MLEKEYVLPLPSQAYTHTRKAIQVAVSSGKGGVGKTTIALKLGMGLVSLGYKVLVVDCDFNLSNTLSKIHFFSNKNLIPLIQEKASIEESMVSYQGLKILPSCNGSIILYQSKICYFSYVQAVLRKCRQDYDYIILDLAAGLDATLLDILELVQHRIVIFNPDKASMMNSYSLLKLMKMIKNVPDAFILLNKYTNAQEAKNLIKNIVHTANSFLNLDVRSLKGIEYFDISISQFDKEVFNGKNIDLNEKFLKMIKDYDERFGKAIRSAQTASIV